MPGLELNQQQRDAIYTAAPLMVVAAGAGSGKTTVLTQRYVHICEVNLRQRLSGSASEFAAGVDGIVAITFTEKAAREMKDRVRQAMSEKLLAVANDYPGPDEQIARDYWNTQLDALTSAPITTFHSFCHRIVSERALEANVSPHFQVLDGVTAKLLRGRVRDEMFRDADHANVWTDAYLAFKTGAYHFKQNVIPIYEKLREIEHGIEQIDALCRAETSKLTGENAKTEADARQFQLVIETFGPMLREFHTRYSALKQEIGAVDFSDLQQLAIQVLSRPHVQQAYQAQYRHFLVDEFQDTNRLQMALLDAIQPSYRFIVGDVKQSVYRFRGADVRLMNVISEQAKTMAQTSQGERARYINMGVNYRTSDSIIQTVNTLFDQLMSHDVNAQPHVTPYAPLESDRTTDQDLESRVEWLAANETEDGSSTDAFTMMGRRMMQMIRAGAPQVLDKQTEAWRAPQWSDMAILMPKRTRLPEVQESLDARGIPYIVHGGVGFYEQPEIRDMLLLLSWLESPQNPLYVIGLLRSPMFGLDVNTLLQLQEAAGGTEQIPAYVYAGAFREAPFGADIQAALSHLRTLYDRYVPFHGLSTLENSLHELFEESGLRLCLLLQKNNLQRVHNVEKLIAMLSHLDGTSLTSLLHDIRQIASDNEKEGDADIEIAKGNLVHIMTVHASKGLEFPIVFLVHIDGQYQFDDELIRYHDKHGIVAKFDKPNDKNPFQNPKAVASDAFEEVHALMKDEILEEEKRKLYVGMTRARDYLVLVSNQTDNESSWYAHLNRIYNGSPALQDSIMKLTDVPEVGLWKQSGAESAGPVRSVERHLPVTLSVSEIMTYLNDPEKYYVNHVLQIPSEWLTPAQTPVAEMADVADVVDTVDVAEVVADEGNSEVGALANPDLVNQDRRAGVESTVLGTLVHAACEFIDGGFSPAMAFRNALALLEEGEDPELYRASVVELVDAYQRTVPHIEGQHVETEFPFCLSIAGAEVIGRIDKVVQSETGFHIIDIKTNQIQSMAELIDYYRPQLHLYKLAFEQARQVPVTEMSLLFLRAGEHGLQPVVFNQDYASEIEAAITRLVDLKRRNAPRSEYLCTP